MSWGEAATTGGGCVVVVTDRAGRDIVVNPAYVTEVMYGGEEGLARIELVSGFGVEVHADRIVDLAEILWPGRIVDRRAPKDGPPQCASCGALLPEDATRATRCECGNIWLGNGVQRYRNPAQPQEV